MDEEIIKGLWEKSMALWEESQYGVCKGGTPCKRECVENVVVELRGETFRRLLQKKWVTLGITSVCVEKCLDLVISGML